MNLEQKHGGRLILALIAASATCQAITLDKDVLISMMRSIGLVWLVMPVGCLIVLASIFGPGITAAVAYLLEPRDLWLKKEEAAGQVPADPQVQVQVQVPPPAAE